MWVRNPRGALFLSIKSTCCRFTAASAQTEFNLWPWNKNYRIKQWISLFSRALFSLCHCCSDTRTQFFLHYSLIASHVLHHLANKVKVNSVSMIAPLLRRFFRRQLPLSKPIQKPTRFNLQNVLIWKVEGSFWKRLNRLPAARFRSCLVLEEATESHSSEVSEEISGCHFVSDWPMREWWNPPSSITSSAKTHGVRKQVWERERPVQWSLKFCRTFRISAWKQFHSWDAAFLLQFHIITVRLLRDRLHLTHPLHTFCIFGN